MLHYSSEGGCTFTVTKLPVLGNVIMGVVQFLVIFKIGLCSAISFKKSRRKLSIDVAGHRSTLKNYENTYFPSFLFHTKNRYSITQNRFFWVFFWRRRD